MIATTYSWGQRAHRKWAGGRTGNTGAGDAEAAASLTPA
jgi:hypothetical protein